MSHHVLALTYPCVDVWIWQVRDGSTLCVSFPSSIGESGVAPIPRWAAPRLTPQWDHNYPSCEDRHAHGSALIQAVWARLPVLYSKNPQNIAWISLILSALYYEFRLELPAAASGRHVSSPAFTFGCRHWAARNTRQLCSSNGPEPQLEIATCHLKLLSRGPQPLGELMALVDSIRVVDVRN